ncbi:scaffold protein Scd2 [Schizosaccharomyces cryophilus OY26]|uniref:Scaffold protein Scd2 n=1 Tax=Schizosaccharomyces cryophilus (strain OY26 / ATCC MYA-4695 / CBS 11777 / NBRC 106824 / NRRL Y48691) TaxID=653667 RepID=S9VW72_SCHCR|nr:scaffold protein Scd2 [Schizosaccharomyces cryophilus OY26]EPY51858.1 scaffold protein Scd2 [Schizosaccharomyces cryophilus OY26]
MVKIRRSWKSHSRISNKDPFSIEPPRKVIRALYDYTARKASEISFTKGDFFHVIGRENDQLWYEVCNPAAGTHGFVPVSHFEEIGKNASSMRNSSGSESTGNFVDLTNSTNSPRISLNDLQTSTQPLFGIVQFDFVAERADELDAKAGETIIIIARSNHEWLVAKPIGRLGGPGLIPLTFIQLRDLKTGAVIKHISEAILRTSCIPRVEDWKRAAADYKKSSIPLGTFQSPLEDSSSSVGFESKSTLTDPVKESSPFSTPSSYVSSSKLSPSNNISDGQYISSASSNTISHFNVPYVIAAMVEAYFAHNNQFWYLVRAVMSDGRHRNLCRYYEDFYHLQLTLLDAFPSEAGHGQARRIIPYMPGPVDDVNELISSQRALDLDVYVKELCRLPSHLLESDYIKKFFLPMEGDVDASHPTSSMPRVVERPFIFLESQKAKSLTAPNTPVSGNGHNNTTPMFQKVKIRSGDETFALRIASDIAYEAFIDKLKAKLGFQWYKLVYRDEATNDFLPMCNADDLRNAFSQKSGALLLAERQKV